MQIAGTAGAGSTTIDAHTASGIFSISSAASVVSIAGLTLTRGQSGGGAVNDAGAQLTLSGDVFTFNTAGGGGSTGGSAVATSGTGAQTLTVADSQFSSN